MPKAAIAVYQEKRIAAFGSSYRKCISVQWLACCLMSHRAASWAASGCLQGRRYTQQLFDHLINSA